MFERDGHKIIVKNSEGVAITIGYTIEQHEAALEKREATVRADLERAYAAEKQNLSNELTILQMQKANLEQSYAEKVRMLDETRSELTLRYNQLSHDDLQKALVDIENGEFESAQVLLDIAEVEIHSQRKALKKEKQRLNKKGLRLDEEEARTKLLKGKIAEQQVRWEEAYNHYKRAFDLEWDINSLIGYSRLAWRLGKYQESFRLYEAHLKRVSETYGEGSAHFLDMKHNLALSHYELGQYDRAEQLFLSVIEAHRNTLTNRHSLSASLGCLSVLYRETRRYDYALKFCFESIDIANKSISLDHMGFAHHILNFATILHFQGHHGFAEWGYHRALEVARGSIGEDHPEIAPFLNNLATLYKDMARHEEAKKLYNKAIHIMQKNLMEFHPDLATYSNNLATLHRVNGEFYEAAHFFRQAMAILETKLPKWHPHTESTRQSLENLYAEHPELRV